MAKRPAPTRRQAAPSSKPRRKDAAAAATQQPKPGPSAATWPETQQRGAAARPKTKRAAHRRTCSAHLTALNSRWRTYISALGLARGGALLAKNRARKIQKLSLLDKNPLSVFSTGNVMRTAVFMWKIVYAQIFPAYIFGYPWWTCLP